MLDALKETLDSLISLLTLFFKHFSKEFFDSIFHKLLALKKKKFMKDSTWFPSPPGWDGRVASYGGLLRDCSGNIICSFHGTLPTCSANEGDINKSLCRKEVSFIHIHRGRKGSADAIARGVGL
ncbi:hypothetical protein AMTRI_Chr09g20450 [Amborella trichopoda]